MINFVPEVFYDPCCDLSATKVALLDFGAIVGPGLLWSVICTVDLILHPFAPSPFFGSGLLRLVVGLVFAPLTIGVALLVVRREARNIVGLLLLLIGEAYCASALRTDIQSPLAAILSAIIGSMEWPGLFLLILYSRTVNFSFVKLRDWSMHQPASFV